MGSIDQIPPQPVFEEGFAYKIILNDVKQGPEGPGQATGIEMKVELWCNDGTWRAKASGLDDRKIASGKGDGADRALGDLLAVMAREGYTVVLPLSGVDKWQRKPREESGSSGVEIRR